MSKIHIRTLTKSDIQPCIHLFQETVHAINSRDYASEQLDTWAPSYINPDSAEWQSLLNNISLVAMMDKIIVGFADMTPSGYLDRLYVHKDYQGRHIASTLLNELEMIAVQQSIKEITTEASITAKPFFEANGFYVVKEQQKIFNGVEFKNFVMIKMMRKQSD